MLKPMMVFGVLNSDFVRPVLKIFGPENQSVGESVFPHIVFFLRSFGMVFYSVVEL